MKDLRRLGASRRGVVTSPHTLASQAGQGVLADGGNAIEAALAMGAVLAVTYPHFCGIGGDAVWMVADREGRRRAFLGIGQAASTSAPAGPIPTRGPGSALTSACVVDSWGHALDYSVRHWDGRRSFASLLSDAVAYAEKGFPLTASQLFWLDFRAAELDDWPGFASHFDTRRSHRLEDRFVQPDLAATLRVIAQEGSRSFYEGALAKRIARGLAEAGSPLTAEDLSRTRTREADPLTLAYGDVTLLAPPPPTQGASTLAIMGIIERMRGIDPAEGSADYYHGLVEAVKQAFLDRDRLADPDFIDQPVTDWLSDARLAAKAAAIDPTRALPWPHQFRTGDTVFFGAVDGEGRSASVLQSLYFDWGSGVVVGDTGILWQNRGAAFSADPASPNAIAPGKRPFYTLNPGIALKAGSPYLVYGTQGADGQPQTLAAILTRILDHGMDPLTALSRPRFLLGRTFSDGRDTLKLEADAGGEVFEELRRRGHAISSLPVRSPLAGQAGAILVADDGSITGAHDPRSDGVALGV